MARCCGEIPRSLSSGPSRYFNEQGEVRGQEVGEWTLQRLLDGPRAEYLALQVWDSGHRSESSIAMSGR